MPKYRFGFDVGASSLGWAVLELDSKGKVCAIASAGSRIFADGRDKQSKATLAATRRESRSARRRRDRFKQRQKYVLSELTKAGLFPADKTEQDKEERANLRTLEPLEWRARALTEKIPLHHLGRALFHLNQRRGFKSNRKDKSKERTSGRVAKSVMQLLEDMDLMGKRLTDEEYKALNKDEEKQARQREIEQKNNALQSLFDNDQLTYGYFLASRRFCISQQIDNDQLTYEYSLNIKEGKPTRARPGSEDSKALYAVYPTREMLEDEFNKIWRAQAKHYADTLTEKRRQRIHKAIFDQRPLKAVDIGQCIYMSGEKRAHRAMPSFQLYRIYQEVNNLSWGALGVTKHLKDHQDARDQIVKLLKNPTTQSGQVTFKKIRNVLKKLGVIERDVKFNLESKKRKGLEGDHTANWMRQEEFVPDWSDWATEKQDAFVELLLSDESEETVMQRLENDYGMAQEMAEACADSVYKLVEGTGNLSVKAARLLTERMRDNYEIQPDAVEAVASEVDGFESPIKRKGLDEPLLPSLPYYGEAFAGGSHIIQGHMNKKEYEEDRDEARYYGRVTNPTVHIALNQIRKVVNELIATYGHPASIAIEMGRELPVGADRRIEIERAQADSQEDNERINKLLQKEGIERPSRTDRLRVQLWEELDPKESGRLCPFSGERIGRADLLNGKAEIEHLLPFYRSLDDSRANLVICTRQANRDKGKRTPYEAFSKSPSGYNWEKICARVEGLPESKQWRFREDAWEIWEKEQGYLGRHLNDTRYIGRLAKEYLEHICLFNKIDVLTGRLTALLRHYWGLNSVLLEKDRSSEDGENHAPQRKNREDHRHHAVDAIVIAATTKAMLQRMSTVSEKEGASMVEATDLFRRGKIDPWQGFRSDVVNVVREIVVSHRVRRKKPSEKSTTGRLHNETAYGKVDGPDKSGKYEVVYRKPVKNFETEKNIDSIRDPVLREEFRDAFKRDGQDGIIKLARAKKIRSLRQTEKLSAIPIKDSQGKEYKLVKGDSNWAMEIYQYPAGHEKEGKWDGVIVSQHKANEKRPLFQPGVTCRPHPAAKLIMRLFVGDILRLKDFPQLMRVQTITKGKITMAPVSEANVDKRSRDKESGFKFVTKSPGELQKSSAQKIHISPTGRINCEKR